VKRTRPEALAGTPQHVNANKTTAPESLTVKDFSLVVVLLGT